MRLDHVIVAVDDLDLAAAVLADDHGLASVPGGVHPDFGTANRIVPVGDGAYVELMAVADPDVAAANALGRWLQARVDDGGGPAGWMLAPDDLDAEALRLGVDILAGQRVKPDGTVVHWRLAGLTEMLARPPCCAFIDWPGPPEAHPSATPVDHGAAVGGVAWVEVAGDEAALRRWIGPDGSEGDVDLRVTEGAPGLRAVGVVIGDGEVVLR